MSYRSPAAAALILLFTFSPLLAGGKSSARVEKLGTAPAGEIRAGSPSLSAADTCFVTDNGVIVYRIGQWVIGQELYKSFMDPANSCPDPYPFTVTEVNMPMYFADGTQIVVSIDLETVDYNTVPGCTVPGIVLTISQDYTLEVPAGGGMFNIWIPLDTPVVVNEPFFAGFFLGNVIDPAAGAEVLCDSIPVPCRSFNIWDESIGWIDLVNNSFYNFPGVLAMEVSGIPGGGGGSGDPEPQAVLLSPSPNQVLYQTADLWAWDSSGSSAIDYVSFEYSGGGAFQEIGRDYDDYSSLRDGVSDRLAGNGLATTWDFSGLSEGTYTLKATIYDTLGRTSSAYATVYLEPTPPIATITTPDNGDNICPPETIIMSSLDEDIYFVQLYRAAAELTYSAGLIAMSQLTVGDINGNPDDGNLAANGEFGTYYSGPVAATVAMQAWNDRGIIGLVAGTDTRETIAEEFAVLFNTREYLGTYDEDLLSGMQRYSLNHGNTLEFDVKRNPDYYEVRSWVEEEQRIVILGLSGSPAVYLVVDGFRDWSHPDSNQTVVVTNPLNGTIVPLSMRRNPTHSELYFGISWQRVDMMVSLLARGWAPERTLVGADFNGEDGWSVSLSQNGMVEGSLYFLQSVGRDASSYEGSMTTLVKYNCSGIYPEGDYDDNGVADIGDLYLLVNFLTSNGPAPEGGAARADANCDNYVNITDIVYYVNFLFGDAAAPCY